MKAPALKKGSGNKKQSFVLMVGDEGAILTQVQGTQVVKRIFASQPERDHLKAMDDLLKSNLKTPVLVVVDMMDQSYVRQTLPPVSSFNVGKIVRRRLNKDFANDDIKGYIILGREKTGRKDWNYLMASLANPPVLQKWIEFAVERPNPFKGIGLVPLECQPLIRAVEDTYIAKAGKDAKPTEWHVLVSHHKVGGFRQVVLRNRQIIFTRLAQLVGEPTPEVIAGNIEQELLNTLEYLKRLGLQDTQNLTATIVASGEIKASFESKALPSNQCHFFTPHEMAGLLSAPDFAKPEDHYGDVVIAAFISSRRKLLLPLFTSYTRKLARLGSYILMTRIAATLAMLGICAWAGNIGINWYNVSVATEELKASLASVNTSLAKEEERKKTLPEKIDRYTDVATLYRSFYPPLLGSLYFIVPLQDSLAGLALAKTYHWSISSPLPPAKGEDKRQMIAEFEAVLLSPQEPREKFVESAKILVEKIKAAYPEYEVSHSDLPGILSDNKELKTIINDTAEGAPVQVESLSSSVTFSIKGPVSGDEKQQSTGSPPRVLPIRGGR